MKQVEAGVLNIAYYEFGPEDGIPAILLHGFPYDARCYSEVGKILAEEGVRSIVPFLRGYGETVFLSHKTLRSGQQAALAMDLVALMDALEIPKALLAGYDWGGRAACIVSALWPERAIGLVSGGMGYNIQNIPASSNPASPAEEQRYWYQYLFHNERGRTALTENRRELCRHIWEIWSPPWAFDSATFEHSARSFDNPDFVDVVIHSYKHRFGLVDGDPDVEWIEEKLAGQPKISVPTIVLQGAEDGVDPPSQADPAGQYFTGKYTRRILAATGHNPPQENPGEFANAVLELTRD